MESPSFEQHTMTEEKVIRLLTIEDELRVRESIVAYFEDSGYEVLEAENGMIGVEVFKTEKPDIVLTDLRMPEMDGLEVLSKIVALDDGVPVIVVSGTGAIQDAIEAVKLGAWDYVTKPIYDMAVLEYSVEKALDKARLIKENNRYKYYLEDEVKKRTIEIEERKKQLEESNNQLIQEIDIRVATEKNLHKRIQQQEALSQLGQYALEASSIQAFLNSALDIVQKSLSVEYIRIMELLEGGEAVKLIAASGWDKGLIGSYTEPLSYSSQVTYTLKEKSSVYVEDFKKEERFPQSSLQSEYKILSGISAIILGQAQPFGVFEVHSAKTGFFTKDDVSFIEAVANLMTSFIDRLKISEEGRKLATAIQQAVESVIITDENGVMQYVNPAFTKTSRYNRAESLGTIPYVLNRKLNQNGDVEKIWQVISDGKVWSGQILNQRKDGGSYQEELTISPIRNMEGETINYVLVSRDVSKEFDLERQLRQAQKMEAIGTLAGGIAHDFNNLLFAIQGYLSLAMEDVPEDDQIRSDLHEAVKASKRAKELVQQILAFSRQQDIEAKSVNLASLLKETLKLIRATVPAYIEIKQEIRCEESTIMADPSQIHQVLVNLCTNASHAMQGQNGVLTIELDQTEVTEEFARIHSIKTGDYIHLKIQDTGYGMNSETLERLFEPFFTTKPVGEGTGMGLAVVHGIVTRFDGAITVFSEPGKGSAFELFFPLVLGDEESEVEDEKKLFIQGSGTVLVVDDEPQLVFLEKKVLERCGYRVMDFLDPLAAWKAFEENADKIDLVVTDHTMPGLTGRQLSQKIVEVRPDLPIIMVTGFTQNLNKTELASEGIVELAMKPIEPHEFSHLVDGVLKRHRK